MNAVEEFYNQDLHQEWERLDRHRTEFAVTLRALTEYLPPAPTAILDVGGGPGRYALALTAVRHNVTLIDLASSSIKRAAEHAKRSNIQLHGMHVGNALDLGAFASESFDAVLLLGPLYHLTKIEERRKAIQEAARVLKGGGLIFVAFLTRYGALRVCAERVPQWLFENQAYAERMLADGIHQGEWGFTTSYHAHTDEVQPVMENNGFTTLQLVGCEGIVAHAEASVNRLDGAAWEWWADLNYRLGKQRDLHGAATHLLYVGHKSA